MLRPSAEGRGLAVQLHTSPGLAGDLRTVEAIAREGSGALVVADGDILTQREALAGLLADPRIATGMLTTIIKRVYRYVGFRTRTRRGRVVSAGTPYHYISQPNGTFLGVLKVAPGDRDQLADVAGRLAALVDGPLPAGWQEELDAKAGRWKLALHRRAQRMHTDPDAEDQPSDEALAAADESGLLPEDVELDADGQAELERRVAAAAGDVPSLLLCGLVRSDVKVGGSHLRKLFWTRPLTPEHVASAAERIGEHDEDRALLDSAVKAFDGFFTTFFVSPYSKYIARWAARRGWTPNFVTTISVLVGFLAAAGFATGERWGMIAGAILLQAAFTLDCVDGQLARYTRTFTKLGAWLDSIFDRTKEYAVFAGLAIGASRTGDDVWLLAGAALALQVLRHSIDFSYPQAEHQAMGAVRQPPLDQVARRDRRGRSGGARLRGAGRAGAGPGGAAAPDAARVACAACCAPSTARRAAAGSRRSSASRSASGSPRSRSPRRCSTPAPRSSCCSCGAAVAGSYTVAGRVLRSLGRRGAVVLDHAAVAAAGTLDAYRDDGPLALAIGRLRLGRLPASALVLAGVAVLLAVIAITGAGASWVLAGVTLAVLIVLAGLSAGQPLHDRLRWTVPPALRAAEYAGILWVAALAGGSAVPGAFALLLAITYRHYDIVYRLRHRGVTPPRWLNRAAGGWDGRLLGSFALAAAALVPAGYYAAAGVFAVAFAAESIAAWATFERGQQPDSYVDEEEEAE